VSPADDLEPEELDLDDVLRRARPVVPPLGLRDRIMARLEDRRVLWEWIVAALFAIPSVAYLARLVLVHSTDIASALGNMMTAASGQAGDAFFFVDGLTVLALALLGIASAFAAHALFVSDTRSRRIAG
jgi:hypothetical protein